MRQAQRKQQSTKCEMRLQLFEAVAAAAAVTTRRWIGTRKGQDGIGIKKNQEAESIEEDQQKENGVSVLIVVL